LKTLRKTTLSVLFAAAFSAPAMATALADATTAALPLTYTQTYNLNWYHPWRGLINAPLPGTAYGGAGVVVGVADSGINATHQMFSTPGKITAVYNSGGGATTDARDLQGHGSHVAGLIAGTMDRGGGVAGIAPDATLAIAKIMPTNLNTTTEAQFNAGVNWLTGTVKAPIVNLSIQGTGAFGLSSMQAGVNRGTLFVVAAGNYSTLNPAWPARYAKESWALGQIIAVGAVDNQGVIASFSNRAGDTAQWYVVAPGVSVTSAYYTSPTVLWNMSGTSMAAPIVAGQAALIKGSWPYLKAAEIAQVIFRTTTDLGAPGTDPIYGRGLINIGRSMQPVGNLGITMVNGKVTVSATLPSSGATTSGAGAGSAKLATHGYDELGRNFEINVGGTLRAAPLTLDSALGSTDRVIGTAQAVLAPGLTFTTHTERGALLTDDSRAQLRAMTMNWQAQSADGGSQHFAMGTGGLGYQGFGLAASPLASNLYGAEGVLGTPLLKYAGNHSFAAYGVSFANGWGVRGGVASSATESLAGKGSVGIAEVTRAGDGYALAASYGALSQPTVLGANNPLMGLDQASSTQALSFSGAALVSKDFALAGSFHLARTSALGSAGLLENASATPATGFGVAAVWSNVLRERDDRLSLSLTAPLRATAGSSTYTVVDAVDPETGAPSYATKTFSNAPSGREKIIELRYATRLDKNTSLSASLVGRLDAGHDANAKPEGMAALRLNATF